MPFARGRSATPRRVTNPHSKFSLNPANFPRIQDGLSEGGGGVATLEQPTPGHPGHRRRFGVGAALSQFAKDDLPFPVELQLHGGVYAPKQAFRPSHARLRAG